MTFDEVELDRLDHLVGDDRVVFQQKFDGTRCIVSIEADGKAAFLGRGGGRLAHTAATQHFGVLRAALRDLLPLDGPMVLDGEILIGTGEFIIFDLPMWEGRIAPADPLAGRLEALASLLGPEGMGPVLPSPTFHGPDGKIGVFRRVQEAGGEGVMAKRLDSPYEPGKRVRHSVKLKFVKTADVVVTSSSRSRNEAGREVGSFTFGAYREDGKFRALGSCSAIGKPATEVGDVIEVAYLSYWGGSLVQPRMRRVRRDKAPQECLTSQLVLSSREVVQ